MAMWLILVALVLGSIGIWLLLRGRKVHEDTGLPAGRVRYADTGAWDRCARPLYSHQHRLTGRPDYLVQGKKGVIPVEVKSRTAPKRPYRAHILQLAAYCLLVEVQEGQAPPYGILKYDDQVFEIEYSRALRADLLNTLDAIRQDLRANDVGRNHSEAARCLSCGYRERCDQRVA
jgi:CRISPR-associated exonuclease Cas4